MKKNYFLKCEYIGSKVEVLSAKCYSSIKGIISYESKNTFTITTKKNKEKIIPKNNNTFKLILNNNETIINGKNILHTPENRIKKIR